MILRRFTLHLKEQNWFAVGLDVVVVIVGIFLGMQVTEWNEARKIDGQLVQYKERLIDDLKADIKILENASNYYRTVKSYGESVLRQLDEDSSKDNRQYILNIYQATQDFNPDINTFTFDEMTAGGLITEIRDIKFRRMISQYFVSNKEVRSLEQADTKYRIRIRELLDHDIQELIKEKCGDRFEYLENNALIVFLPISCELEIPTALVIETLSALSRYPTLKEDLNYRLSQISIKISDLKNTINQAERIVNYVQ